MTRDPKENTDLDYLGVNDPDGVPEELVSEDIASEFADKENGTGIAYISEEATNISNSVTATTFRTGESGIFSKLGLSSEPDMYTVFIEGGPGETEELAEAIRSNPERFGVEGEPDEYSGGIFGMDESDLEARFEGGGGLDPKERKRSAANLGWHNTDEAGAPTEEELYRLMMEIVSNYDGNKMYMGITVPDNELIPHAYEDVVNVLDNSGHDVEEMDMICGYSPVTLNCGGMNTEVVINTPPDAREESHYNINTAVAVREYD